jgi:hypothetical protein
VDIVSEKAPPLDAGKRRSLRTLVILVLLSVSGCAGRPLPDFPRDELERYQISRIEGDAAVAIQPLMDRREVEKYFGLNLLDRGILPVFLLIENRADDRTLVFDARRLALKAKQEHPLRGDSDLEDDRAWQAAAATGAVLLSLPIMIVASKMISNQAEREQNLATKELRSQTLEPSGATSGFAYFDVGSVDLSSAWTLRVELMETRSRSWKAVELHFDWIRGDQR